MMKIIAASDIHSSQPDCALLVAAFEREQADRLLLLGDILTRGSREGEDTEQEEVAVLLNGLSQHITCVRGNCDWASNQRRLTFPCMDAYTLLNLGGATVFASHGHRYNEQLTPPVPFDILLNGHTHVPGWREHEDYLYLNPGSVSQPRGGSVSGYLILEENFFTWKDMMGNVLFSHRRAND